MGCPCQGQSRVWTPPVVARDGAAAQQQRELQVREARGRGPMIWTGTVQPPAQQKG